MLVSSLPVFVLILGSCIVAMLYGEFQFWSVFVSVLCSGFAVLFVAVLVGISLIIGIVVVSPWAAWLTQGKSPSPEISPPPPRKSSFVQVDESTRISKIEWYLEELPPSLYVDDYTVTQEVPDLLMLREGDHCIVGLNLMPQFSQFVDAFISRITSWEAAPFRIFHHFILLDSVATLSDEKVPLRADGEAVRIAEFSETLPGAMARVFADGYHPKYLLRNVLALLASPAQYHVSRLVDYLPPSRRHGRRGNGIFVVLQTLTDEDRRLICEDALAFQHAPEMPAYDPVTANCEHICFLVSAQGRWASPQVAHIAWNLVRLLFQCVGAACLAGLTVQPTFIDAGVWHGLLSAFYHLFSTFVLLAAVNIQLVRTVFNLTRQRQAIGQLAFHYLIIKETIRAIIVGGLSIGVLAWMPRLALESRHAFVPCMLSLTIYAFACALFNVSHQLVVRTLLRSGMGVPVMIFQDLRDPEHLDAVAESKGFVTTSVRKSRASSASSRISADDGEGVQESLTPPKKSQPAQQPRCRQTKNGQLLGTNEFD